MPRNRFNPYSGKHGSLLRIGLSEPSQAPASKEPLQATGSGSKTPAPISRRGDGPPCTKYARGSKESAIEIASNPDKVQEAINAHNANVFSSGHAKVRQNQEELWDDISEAASGKRPIQLTAETMCRNISILRASKFRSAMAIASVAKFRHIEHEFPWTPALQRQWDKSQKAVHRGLGPAAHASPFPLGEASKLIESSGPISPTGPMHPARTIKIGCWWLLREVELGNCCLRDVTEEQDNSVNILLPASKADVMALGESRGHGCACENRTDGPALMPTRMCPACLLKAQLKFVREEFPGLGQDAPLFPGSSGKFPTKAGVINTISALAGQLGKKEKTHSGAPCWGGHAMRRGGAQYLAAAGVDVWRIQALARHSSAAILAYIEKAHVPTLKSISVEAASGRQQHALATEVAKLKELICKGLRVKEPSETVKPYNSLDNLNANWICTEKAGGKIHTKSKSSPGSTLCKWRWARTPRTTHCEDAFGPPNDYRPTCMKCTRAEKNEPDDSSINSTDEEDSE
jgi:hypothetical protein